jgi:hypothetical protein
MELKNHETSDPILWDNLNRMGFLKDFRIGFLGEVPDKKKPRRYHREKVILVHFNTDLLNSIPREYEILQLTEQKCRIVTINGETNYVGPELYKRLKFLLIPL